MRSHWHTCPCPARALYAGLTLLCGSLVLTVASAAQPPAPGEGAPSALLPAGAARPLPRLDTRRDVHPGVKQDRDGNLIFRNEHLVAVVLKTGEGFGGVQFYPATRATERPSEPVATVLALARLMWREGEQSQAATFMPTEVRLSRGNRAELRGVVRAGGVSWETEAELWIGREAWLSWEVKTRPSVAARLTRFAPMPLRTGGEGPREALFPGLEYLEGDESTSGAGGAPGDANSAPRRLVPDPYRITIPLMSLVQNRTLVALMWDQVQNWGGAGYPAALFGIPTRAEGQGSHRMELFLPPVPQYVKENEEVAAEPLPLEAGRQIRLSGKIVVRPEEANPTRA
ncbi:MAG TPA: hypothetical protein VK689_14245, partial [Armatimonadota bacterium]|nr:hypothetical protein [Armatimonadota bacterium]